MLVREAVDKREYAFRAMKVCLDDGHSCTYVTPDVADVKSAAAEFSKYCVWDSVVHGSFTSMVRVGNLKALFITGEINGYAVEHVPLLVFEHAHQMKKREFDEALCIVAPDGDYAPTIIFVGKVRNPF